MNATAFPKRIQFLRAVIPIASVILTCLSDNAIARVPSIKYSLSSSNITIEPTDFKPLINHLQYLTSSCISSFFDPNSSEQIFKNNLNFSIASKTSSLNFEESEPNNFLFAQLATEPVIVNSLTAPAVAEQLSSRQTNLPVKQIEILGSTVLQTEIVAILNSNNFSNIEKAEMVCHQHSNNKKSCSIEARVKPTGITLANLLALRSAISQLYIDNDYITSGAFLPSNQILKDTVRIEVLEGSLEQVELKGLNRLSKSYILSRLPQANAAPLNQQRLLAALQLLQLNPLIERVNAELIAGNRPDRSILLLDIKEANAFNFGILAANNRSPSIGSTQGSVFVSHDNLLGFGDRFSAEYGATEGLDIYGVSYALPVNSMDGTLSFRYSNDGSSIIEDNFEELNISSNSETFSFGFRQPVVRKPQTELAVGLNLDLRRNQTFLQNEPFSFSTGSTAGESNVTVLRLVQEWSNRQQQTVLAARSELSFGLDAFNATTGDNQLGVDGRFFAWRGQFQYAKQFANDFVLVAGVSTQLTPDSLLSLEQISIGGNDTVRGYRANQSVADNGVVSSLELRIPLISNSENQLQFTPFVEMGTVWNSHSDRSEAEPTTIASLGTGLRWQIDGLNISFSYGLPLVSTRKRGDSLQENGIHFSLRYQP